MPLLDSLRKPLRFVRIYGVRRTLYKIAARKRGTLALLRPRPVEPRDVGMVGCGQFAFATIGCIVAKRLGNRFGACFDPAPEAASTFAEFYGISVPAKAPDEVLLGAGLSVVYIASNHSTHAPYAVQALRCGSTVYCEKPVATSVDQARALFLAARENPGRIYAGYNRPFSSAIRELRPLTAGAEGPLTLNCFIAGHVIGADHWYRAPAEGTRVCGNVGHWLDLAVHALRWSSTPDRFRIRMLAANPAARDDDVSIAISTPRGDLISIVLTARGEPFEGINETINFQQGSVTAKIDDFRSMTVWSGPRLIRRRYRPKDVGHEMAIMQPFGTPPRDWHEVEVSTLLMLRIAEMVRSGEDDAELDLRSAYGALGLEFPWPTPTPTP
jgi:predicted dehydrogenase